MQPILAGKNLKTCWFTPGSETIGCKKELLKNFKARLETKRYTEVGIHYCITYVPLDTIGTFGVLVALAPLLFHIHQVHVQMAF